MLNKKGLELSISLLVKVVLALILLLLLIFLINKYGGEFFRIIGQQMKNAVSSLTDLEFLK